MIKYSTATAKSKFGCLVIPVFEDGKTDALVKDLNEVHHGLFDAVQKLKDFEGKKGQMTFLYTGDQDVSRVLLVGLGKKKGFGVRGWKHAIGSAVIAAQGKKVTKLGVVLSSLVLKGLNTKKLAESTVVAIETANYAFDDHKTGKDAQVKPLQSVEFVGELDKRQARAWQSGIEEGKVLGEAVNFTRHLGNTPPTVMTPTFLAQAAEKLAQQHTKLKTKVLSRPEMKKLGMGCLLGVSQGSVLEPKFIILEYSGAAKNKKPTVLVGKGITFDSGGLSIKPDPHMSDMKFDMLGGATVLGIIKAAAGLGLKKNIVGLVPTCENMPGGGAYRPDDILINIEGRSVLIDNTDAEGRLILSDALGYAKRYQPKEVIDFATLTGACVVALGNERSGLFSPEEKIVAKLLASSEAAGEQLWRLPIGEEYSEAMKCEIADIKNTGGVGGRRYAGASTAAAFLQFFTLDQDGNSEYPWAHIDLSCSYYGGKGKPYIRHGANGFGVESLIEYLR